MKKNIIFIVVLLLMFCSFSRVYSSEIYYYENNNGIKMTEEEYNKFLSLGYTEWEIAEFEQKLYESMKNSNYDSYSITKEYYEETYIYKNKASYDNWEQPIEIITRKTNKNEYDNNVKATGYVKQSLSLNNFAELLSYGSYSDAYYETTSKVITLAIWKDSTSTSKRKIDVSLTWKTMPKVRSYDIIAVRINPSNSALSSGTQSGGYDYTYASVADCNMSKTALNKTYGSSNSGWNYKQINSLSYYGVGLTHQLASDTIGCYNDAGAAITRRVTSMTTHISVEATTSSSTLTAYATYQHASSSVAFDDVRKAYDFKSGGLGNVISFSSSSIANKYDGMGGVSLSY